MGKKRKLVAPKASRPSVPHATKSAPRAARASSAPSPAASTSAPPARPQQPPTLPFSPQDSILLVGEGDLSFAASLVAHHGCERVVATVLEPSRAALLAKYPHAAAHLATLDASAGAARVQYGVDARRLAPRTRKPAAGAPDGAGREGALDRILFNFPHVGGKSTDVNRQVRHNQELLAGFFARALPSLSPGGAVVVTLFEGEPYTLWNVRDLARHAGLQVRSSFRFDAAAYPGYRHARTLGVVRSARGEVGGGWRGEERAARSYVFVRKDDDLVPQPGQVRKKRKRAAADDGSSDDSE